MKQFKYLFVFLMLCVCHKSYSIEDKGYVLSPSVWPTLNIPVCWEVTGSDIEKTWVRESIETSWESASRVRFTGWVTCPQSSFFGIRVGIDDIGPHVKRLGRYLSGMQSGMVLNFTFTNWSPTCASRRQECIQNIAIHEFGHALGFAHEQNRPDTPQWCSEEQGTDGDVVVGEWDLNSVMNYCNPIWTNNGQLSAGDIATVQQFYNSRFDSPSLWQKSFGYDAGGWRVQNHPRMMADVNGDGKQDVVGFANAGVYVSLSTGTSFSAPQRWVDSFGYKAGGWRVQNHPRMMADVNGDGKQDVVGFANAGVYVSLSTGTSFSAPQRWVDSFGYKAGGWRVQNHPRIMADVNGDGKQDVVGFANAGVYVSLSTGTSFSAPQRWVDSFGYKAGGWRVQNHPRMMADVNSDGKQDVVGFANAGVYVSLSTGTSFSAPQRWVDSFGYKAGGWRVQNHPRIMADVNGDGKQDVVGFANAGVYVSLSTGTSFSAPQRWVDSFGYKAGGWRVQNHPRMMADVNGDGKQDVVGFANAGVYVSMKMNSAIAYQTPTQWVDSFGYKAGGWRVQNHPRMMADVNGDGRDDVVGFANAGVYVSLSN